MSGFENQYGLTLGQLEGYRKPRLCSERASALCHLVLDPAQMRQFKKHLGYMWKNNWLI